MGWFSKKDQVRKDPQTGLMSVKVGDTWIPEKPELMVTRDFIRYFRDKHMSPGDTVYLTAWTCGFMAGGIVGMAGAPMDQPSVQKLIRQIHDAIDEGIKAGREGQDPAIRERYKKAGRGAVLGGIYQSTEKS
jgi:hypothetical protein